MVGILFNKTAKIKPLITPVLNFLVSQEHLQQWKNKIKGLYLKRVSMKSETREYLHNYFDDDVKMLSKLLNIDLHNYWGE